MFSRLFKSARSIISTKSEPAPATAWKPISLQPETPASTKKPKSPKLSTGSSTTKPKTSKSKASTKEAASAPRSSAKQPLVTITNPTPRRTRVHSPEMVTTRHQHEVGADELADENSINVSVPESVSVKKSNNKRAVDSIDGVLLEGTPSREVKKRKMAALPVRKKDGAGVADEEVIEEEVKTNTRPVVEIRVSKKILVEAKNGDPRKKHKKFGSGDDGGAEPEISSTTGEGQTIVEDDESSDDDAPEEVGAQIAALEAKGQAQSAKLAIQNQKRARKERASRVQAKSKKRLDDPTEKKNENEDEDPISGESDEEAESNGESEAEEELPVKIPISRRVQYEVAADKTSKDHTIGSTTYRVTKVQNEHLAPASNKSARNRKEDWMYARGPKAGANRGQARKAFL